uniref:Alkylated DNA repair protein AlkB homologue 8 N-terminal domain-containing protein n=1 Tax=Oncorhynchus kisutch TaxID=8019 RepID=A0A8C7KLB1_ONCKI
MFCIASDNNIDEYADSVCEFIRTCVEDVIPIATIKTFPNQKPWIDGSIRVELKARTTAFNQGKVSGNMTEFKQCSYSLRKAIKQAKRQYRDKVESQFNGPDTRGMWQGLQSIMDYRKKSSPVTDQDVLLPGRLNNFFARFEDNTVPLTRPATKTCGLSFTAAEVSKTFERVNASNSIIKFADDTTVVGLITNNDETAYREEVRALGVWCQENNLTLNVNKTKEMIVDFRKQQREHPPIHIDGTVVERVASFKFLGIHITDKLNWSTHTDSIVKKAQQRLFNLRRLKKFVLSPKALTNFYRCTIESILSGCITAWYGNCSALNRKALQRVVRSAQRITGGKLPALQDTYTTRCYRKAIKIIKDINHPSHCLFTPLSSRRRGQYRCIKAGTERLKNSFYLKAIRLLNSHH